MNEKPEQPWAYWTEPDWATVDGLRTAYRRKGDGESLVFFHGAGLTRTWLPFYEELSRGFDVIVPEHPGFGDTAMPSWLNGMDDLVLHYDAFLDTLGIEGAHLVGHSLGGWLAAYMAFFFPRRFKSLTLITPIGLRVQDAPVTDPFRIGPEEAMDLLLSGAPVERYAEYMQQGDELENTLHNYAEATTFARLFWNPRYDIKLDRRLQRLRIPTLVVGAEDDRMVPFVHAQRWAELISGSTLTTLEGEADEPTSHLLFLQRPKQLATLIQQHAAALAS